MVGYLEGLGSERGIACPCTDSIPLREFMGYGLDKNPPEHSTLSKTRKRLSLEAHAAVVGRVPELLLDSGRLSGKTLGLDSTMVDANAAMRTIVRRDDGAGCDESLTELAGASGIETPTRQDLAKVDRKHLNKASNKEWMHAHHPDARVTKMADRRTHLAHKVEQAVDMETGAVVGVDGADDGWGRHDLVAGDAGRGGATGRCGGCGGAQDVVADKGHHSIKTMTGVRGLGLRS